jgi:aryl-alcohol dehydrogenase-like predicted oxidoreductase
MQRNLTIAGADVPRIGLGTNRLEHTEANVAFVRDAVAAGVGLIDTAHLYAGGESERTIGDALAGGRPDGLVVATKGGYHDASPEVIAAEIEESRARLQTDRIDLYYLHRPDDDVPLERSLEAIDRERDRGRIGHIAVSQVDVAQLDRARAVTEIAAVQNHYNIAHREHDDVVDRCAELGIPFVAFFPLRDETPAVQEVAARHGVTTSAVILAWLLARSETVLPIPGTLSVGHLRENLAALDLELTAEDLAALA